MTELRGWPAVRVIARREIRERARDRSTLISTLVTLVILAAVVVLPSILGGGDPQAKVAVSDGAGRAIFTTAHAGQKAFSVRLTATTTRNDGVAIQRVRDGDADVAITGDGTDLTVARGAPDGAVAAVQAASARVRAQDRAGQAGLSAADAAAILDPPPLPTTTTGDEDSSGVAFVVLLVLYGQLLAYGIAVAMGVVEEKQSRIVELVLSAIRPRDLLAGKVLGVGVVGFVQLMVYGAVGLALAAATGRLDVGGSGALGAVGISLAWFVLGYALFACAYATGGALVSRQEELQAATTPITMAIIGSFLVSLSALSDPSSTLATVLSFIPTCTPLVMPVRMIAGEASALEVVLGVLVMVAAITLLVRLAGRVYANVVLRTGARVKLGAALRRGGAA